MLAFQDASFPRAAGWRSIEEFQLGLMDQCRCLQRVIGTFARQVPQGDSMQFVVQGGREFVQRQLIASAQLFKQCWYRVTHGVKFTIAGICLRIFCFELASCLEIKKNTWKGSIMKNNVTRIIAAIVISFALQSQAALAQGLSVPPVPVGLSVPAGNTGYLKGSAVGTQNYICLPEGAGFAWKFLAPQATLFLNFRVGSYQIAHFPRSSE